MPATGRTAEYVANRARRPQVSPCPRICRSNTDQRAHDGARRSNARRLVSDQLPDGKTDHKDQKRRKNCDRGLDRSRPPSRKEGRALRSKEAARPGEAARPSGLPQRLPLRTLPARRSQLPQAIPPSTTMTIILDELNVAELRWLCRQYDLRESYDRDDMRGRIRTAHKKQRLENK